MDASTSRDHWPLPNQPLNPYADLLVGVRRSARLNRTELSALLGTPEHTVALWEDPSFEGVDLSILHRVAAATGRELDVRFRPVIRADQQQGLLGAKAPKPEPVALRNLQAS